MSVNAHPPQSIPNLEIRESGQVTPLCLDFYLQKRGRNTYHSSSKFVVGVRTTHVPRIQSLPNKWLFIKYLMLKTMLFLVLAMWARLISFVHLHAVYSLSILRIRCDVISCPYATYDLVGISDRI